MAGTGDPRGFLTIKRAEPVRRPVQERTKDWREFYVPAPDDHFRTQGARCMDCGVPFCQGDTGCPVQNVIPEWNALVQQGRWQEASLALHATNNFPELTGRLCPAPCESACVLGLIEQPVAIRNIEQAIADKSFSRRLGRAASAGAPDSGYRVAVVGSGPAGLAAAQQLRRLGPRRGRVREGRSHRWAAPLRHPRLQAGEGGARPARFGSSRPRACTSRRASTSARDLHVTQLRDEFDAVLLAGGAQKARELRVPGRELGGVHLAMDYLTQQNRRVAGDAIDDASAIWARRQARRRHRRRRHGLRLHRHLRIVRARREVIQFELLPRAAEGPRRVHAVAAVADEAAHAATRTRRVATATGASRRRSCRARAARAAASRGARRAAAGRATARSSPRSPAAASRSTSISCCSPWASPACARKGCSPTSA